MEIEHGNLNMNLGTPRIQRIKIEVLEIDLVDFKTKIESPQFNHVIIGHWDIKFIDSDIYGIHRCFKFEVSIFEQTISEISELVKSNFGKSKHPNIEVQFEELYIRNINL